eukprot:scaffold6198_cov408-Prasinococcus_capsulatus_cf.AAC.9
MGERSRPGVAASCPPGRASILAPTTRLGPLAAEGLSSAPGRWSTPTAGGGALCKPAGTAPAEVHATWTLLGTPGDWKQRTQLHLAAIYVEQRPWRAEESCAHCAWRHCPPGRYARGRVAAALVGWTPRPAYSFARRAMDSCLALAVLAAPLHLWSYMGTCSSKEQTTFHRVVSTCYRCALHSFEWPFGYTAPVASTERAAFTLRDRVLDPGIIGGLLLPVLGALPDTAIIVVRTLPPTLVPRGGTALCSVLPRRARHMRDKTLTTTAGVGYSKQRRGSTGVSLRGARHPGGLYDHAPEYRLERRGGARCVKRISSPGHT